MNCKICGHPADFFSSTKILQKYSIKYYRCSYCGFVQTEYPYWLEEAYSRPINISDTGIMARNIQNTHFASALLGFCFNSDGKFVDYGGGYGIFVRMMRDQGFDFYRDDKYCANLFANGFDSSDSGTDFFDLLTAFEVFEHFVDPSEELEKLLTKSDSILFSTTIIPDDPPKPTEWWYYGLEHGQHISRLRVKSLKTLAAQRRLNFLTNYNNKHLITSRKLPHWFFKLLSKNVISKNLSIFIRRKSFTIHDYEKISGRYLNSETKLRI